MSSLRAIPVKGIENEILINKHLEQDFSGIFKLMIFHADEEVFHEIVDVSHRNTSVETEVYDSSLHFFTEETEPLCTANVIRMLDEISAHQLFSLLYSSAVIKKFKKSGSVLTTG